MYLKKSHNITNVGEDVQSWNPCELLWEYKMVMPLWITVWCLL